MLGFEFPDVFVKARLMADVTATELQYPLAAQRILQTLFTNTAFHVDVCALPPRPGFLAVHDPRHASGRARRRLLIECGTAGCEGLCGAGRGAARVGAEPYKRHEQPKLSDRSQGASTVEVVARRSEFDGPFLFLPCVPVAQ